MRFGNIKLKTIITEKEVILIGLVKNKAKKGVEEDEENSTTNDTKIDFKNTVLLLNEKKYDIKFIRGFIVSLFIAKIPIQDLLNAGIHNKPYLFNEKSESKTSIRYSIIGKMGKYKNGKVKKLTDIGTSIYVRQTANNRLAITVRKINKTDDFKEQLKINLAFIISKFVRKYKILMYEKESKKYEESASVVYEKLIDEKYKNVYYIIDKNSNHIENIQEKYRKNIIYKYSMKHYIAFFSAKTLIGTESPGHAIELRVANKHAVRRIYGNKFQYVFLQHGVMYMVSLDSASRNFFRKNGGMPANSKIVVSSEKEANHFIELAGYNKEDLYICGLPKYDRNKLSKKAEKITIMLTWRPWEYNIVRNNINKSRYFKLLKKIIEAIPNKLKDKIVLMPHPLILEDFKKSKLSKYILDNFTYNEVLENTKLLITDYSSIAYDSFYRGGNIIFYWEEKDYCMDMYKGSLMLNDDNAFGEICYSNEKLKEIVERVYNSKQEQSFIENYRKIVEFHDNKNTERLIEFLKKDKII